MEIAIVALYLFSLIACPIIARDKRRSLVAWILLAVVAGPFAFALIACLSSRRASYDTD